MMESFNFNAKTWKMRTKKTFKLQLLVLKFALKELEIYKIVDCGYLNKLWKFSTFCPSSTWKDKFQKYLHRFWIFFFMKLVILIYYFGHSSISIQDARTKGQETFIYLLMKRLFTKGCISRGINMKIFLTTLKVPAPKVCSTFITFRCFCYGEVKSWKCLESYSKNFGIRWVVITWTPIRKLKGKMVFCF